jgi:CBS domain-containing protein
MNVQDAMTSDVQCCGPDTNLAAAAKMMWDADCGVLPVLNVEGQVLGMITDRDICMACATKNRAPSEIPVWEAVSGKTYRCKMSDDVHTVMDIMKREQVRRLPVVDEEGVLQGLISMNDFILLAGETKAGKAPAISCEDVARALKAISAHRTLDGPMSNSTP